MHGLSLAVVSGGYLSLQRTGFSSVVEQALGAQSSVAVFHRLSCSEACGVFLDQGLNLCPLHWQVDCHPLYHYGSPELNISCNFYPKDKHHQYLICNTGSIYIIINI